MYSYFAVRLQPDKFSPKMWLVACLHQLVGEGFCKGKHEKVLVTENRDSFHKVNSTSLALAV